jgi:hypothetical protein
MYATTSLFSFLVCSGIVNEEIEELQRKLAESERLREKAEQLVQPQTIQPYLEAIHSIYLAIKVVTDRTLATQGDTTNPTSRVYPQQIIPSDDFAMK